MDLEIYSIKSYIMQKIILRKLLVLKIFYNY